MPSSLVNRICTVAMSSNVFCASSLDERDTYRTSSSTGAVAAGSALNDKCVTTDAVRYDSPRFTFRQRAESPCRSVAPSYSPWYIASIMRSFVFRDGSRVAIRGEFRKC